MPNDTITTQDGVTAAAGAEENNANNAAPGVAEPEGSGGVPGASGGEGDANPFDFLHAGDDETVAAPNTTQEESGGGDYAPDYGADFNETDEVRQMITGHAREAGIEAVAAGRFVSALCTMFKQQQQEQAAADYEALQKEWGGAFEKNMNATKRFLGGMLRRGEISEADARELMTPAAFRFAHAVQARLGEGRTAGTGARDLAASRKSELNDIINNPNNPYFKVLNNPNSEGYREAADYVNGLAGFKLY